MPTVIKLFTLFALLLLESCSSAPEKELEKPELPPTVVEATVTASDQVNPDGSGRASPIVVWLYQLKSLGAFESADFYQLYEDHEAQLGTDLIAAEKLFLQPDSSQTYLRTLTVEPTYLAVIAAYRDQNQSIWRASVRIPAQQISEVLISVDELSVTMTLEELEIVPVIQKPAAE